MGDSNDAGGSKREERYKPAVKAIQSTGGAVAVRNEKGEYVMQKVKVTRYFPGSRPTFATDDEDSSESSDEDDAIRAIQQKKKQQGRREITAQVDADEEDEEKDAEERRQRMRGRRQFTAQVDEDEDENNDKPAANVETKEVEEDVQEKEEEEEEEEEEEDADDRRQRMLKARARAKAAEAEQDEEEEEGFGDIAGANDKEDEEGDEEESEDSESEYETATDSDEDDIARLVKPKFVKKSQRLTQLEREATEEAAIEREKALELKVEERKKESRDLVVKTMQDEINVSHQLQEKDIDDDDGEDNEEEELEAWKVRELKRIKREQQKRDEEEKERAEVERLRDMTEEERVAELKTREKVITNAQDKEGKMKFMQKYYHRGAFYMDKEEDIYKRSVMEPTLEDHYDKETMPAVMQVKNFGKIGRTKYTHLKDQDTSAKESGWAQKNVINERYENKRAGTTQNFER